MEIMSSPSARFFNEISSFINAKSSLQDPLESDPLLLENKLSDWIARSTFPSSFFQPVLRGLPRQFLQTDPSISIVKRAFRNEPILIRQWLERPLLTLYSIDLLHNPLCLEKSEIFSQVFRNCLQFRISRMSRLEKSRRESGIKTCEKRTILQGEWGYARDLIIATMSWAYSKVERLKQGSETAFFLGVIIKNCSTFLCNDATSNGRTYWMSSGPAFTR